MSTPCAGAGDEVSVSDPSQRRPEVPQFYSFATLYNLNKLYNHLWPGCFKFARVPVCVHPRQKGMEKEKYCTAMVR